LSPKRKRGIRSIPRLRFGLKEMGAPLFTGQPL
jgi:hypothetical protein